MRKRRAERLLWGGVALSVAFSALALPGQSPTRGGTPEAAAQVQQARRTAEQGDVGRALGMAQAIVAAHPAYEPALKLEGMLLEEAGHQAEAAALYDRALKLAPNDGDLLLKMGMVRLITGQTDAAIELLNRLLKQLPRDRDALYYLAQAYHLKGENDLALRSIQACLKADPQNASVWQKYGELLSSSGDNLGALRWLTKARRADPALPRIDFDLGVANYNNQNLEEADRYATKAVEARSNNLEAMELLAATEVKLSQWEQAKSLFERILSVRSDDDASLLGLGHCQLALKNYGDAVVPLERLLRRDPTQVLAHFYLARAYAGLGRTADAERETELHSRMLRQASSPRP